VLQWQCVRARTATFCKMPAPTADSTATHCITLQHTATHCNTLQHTATYSHKSLRFAFAYHGWHCNTHTHTNTATCTPSMQHIAATCPHLQPTESAQTMTHDDSMSQCVAVCCSVLQCVAVCEHTMTHDDSMSQCVAVCCSVLQCVAVCCCV